VYTETHNASTNSQGLVNLKIGNGTTTDVFADIDWSADAYYLKVEMDPAGGTSYSHYSTAQMLSVPYALHSKNAGMFDGNGSAFYLDAGNINAGTLNNARFSAYSNLGDGGYIDNTAGTDLLTQEQGDGRYITGITTSATSGLDGGETSGTAVLTVDPTDFNAVPASDLGGGVNGIANAYTTIASASINIPKAGYVVAIGTTLAYFATKSVANPETELWMGLTTTSGGTPAAGEITRGEVEYNANGTGHPAATISISQAIYFGTSGSKTIYLKIKTNSVDDEINASYPNLTVFFIPE